MTIEQLISEIRYQLPLGVTTFGPCATEGCAEMARGSRRCIDCLEKELCDKCGYEAAHFCELSIEAHDSALRMLKMEDK